MSDRSTTPPARSEISARMGFAQNSLRRDGELRTGESLAAALAHPNAKIHLTGLGKWLIKTAGERLDAGFSLDEARRLGADPQAAILLGFDTDDIPVLAAIVPIDDPDRAIAAGLALIDLRDLAMEERLDAETIGRLGQATHLVQWHRKTQFCGVCGQPTRSEAAGYRRACTACDNVIFPRTDPVTIMLVHDGEGRYLLGRQARFAENFWSCLAGFVEPGETVEDAVRRETLEEAGIAVGAVTIVASQPWPFPGNLMIGCIAEATSRDIHFDRVELEACRWFDRNEVETMFDGTHPQGLVVPRSFAIAHHLIKVFITRPADGENG
ncbi:NAD(+) diphosphatase [Jiella sp. MQZ9-1]|uniref:NAD(+) diphosphatase n=1 Tax=Jiella flava TaxID=2816857 RepID=A0A939FZC5_9HYPH|nr:NAD(+) diphosphatase [Jiella flava]MBO0662297.1 NAD(+) diphosphatase [Jiella flava]MCD2470872.1 NAD(+) diphosphatase [Jiella flava]